MGWGGRGRSRKGNLPAAGQATRRVRVRVAVRCGAVQLLFGQLGNLDQGSSASRQRPESSFRRPAQQRGRLALLFVDGMTEWVGAGGTSAAVLKTGSQGSLRV
jgi:hypothetical protein